MCPCAVAVAVTVATYVKKQLGMHVRGLQPCAGKFLLSCPWANEAPYPNEIWDSLPEIHALSVASFPENAS